MDPRLGDSRLCRLDLELTLMDVIEVLGRTNDDVDERPDIGEQRRDRRATDQNRIADPAARVGRTSNRRARAKRRLRTG